MPFRCLDCDTVVGEAADMITHKDKCPGRSNAAAEVRRLAATVSVVITSLNALPYGHQLTSANNSLWDAQTRLENYAAWLERGEQMILLELWEPSWDGRGSYWTDSVGPGADHYMAWPHRDRWEVVPF